MKFERSTSNNESSTLHPASQTKTNGLPIQRKLSIGAVNDPLEYEADAMADKVMRMPEQNFIQRKCAHCEEEERAQRKPLSSFIQKKQSAVNNSVVASDSISNQIQSTKGNGNGMSESTKSFMESRFGADFSNVKIHTGSYASQLSKDLNAQAFTVGNDIYFKEGKYQPQSTEGNHLLAHELTHVTQQQKNNKINGQIARQTKPQLHPGNISFTYDEGSDIIGHAPPKPNIKKKEIKKKSNRKISENGNDKLGLDDELLVTISLSSFPRSKKYQVTLIGTPGGSVLKIVNIKRIGSSILIVFRPEKIGREIMWVNIWVGDSVQGELLSFDLYANVVLPYRDFKDKCITAQSRYSYAQARLMEFTDNLSISYRIAWNNVKKRLDDENERRQTISNLMLTVLSGALVFVSGTAASIIAGVMGKMAQGVAKEIPENARYLIDGIKDLAKYGMNQSGSSLLKEALSTLDVNAFEALPENPEMWETKAHARAWAELSIVSKILWLWNEKADANQKKDSTDSGFSTNFDPNLAIQENLTVMGLPIINLPTINTKQRASEFEKGMWADWLSNYAYVVESHTNLVADELNIHPISYTLAYLVSDEIKNRCKEIGLTENDIKQYTAKSEAKGNKEIERLFK